MRERRGGCNPWRAVVIESKGREGDLISPSRRLSASLALPPAHSATVSEVCIGSRFRIRSKSSDTGASPTDTYSSYYLSIHFFCHLFIWAQK